MQHILLLDFDCIHCYYIGCLFCNIYRPIEISIVCKNKTKIVSIISFINNYKNNTFIDNTNIVFNFVIINDISNETINNLIQKEQPNIIINTNGPFIYSNNNDNSFPLCYSIPKLCAENKINYIDIADNRDYLLHFNEYLNKIAKENNVILLSGVNMTPGITMEIIKYLIEPNNKEYYNNKPICSIDSIKFLSSYNNILTKLNKQKTKIWSDIQSYQFRWLLSKNNIVRYNTIDTDLINSYYNTNNDFIIPVNSYTGLNTNSFLQVFSLLFKIHPFTSILTLLQHLNPIQLNKTSGFSVHVNGKTSDNIQTTRIFDFFSKNNDDKFMPYIPCIITILNILKYNNSNKGAYICGEISEIPSKYFSFIEYIEMIKAHNLCIYWSIFDEDSNSSKYLYKRVLGSRFYQMPKLVQELHSAGLNITTKGTCKVIRGTSIFSKIIGYINNIPKAGDNIPVSVTIPTLLNTKYEGWLRNFNGNKFSTVQWYDSQKGTLIERILLSEKDIEVYKQPNSWKFKSLFNLQASANIYADENGLKWDIKEFRILGGLLKLPKFLHSKTIAEESIEIINDTEYFKFYVKIYLPLGLGLLVHYTGHLQIESTT